MKPTISEFSFGYAVTEEIVKQQRRFITSAPIFPSLKEEGQPGGGYDLQIQRYGFPLFLQFKLSHKMERANCKEVRGGYFEPPFFRMYLMPEKLSQQHRMLLDLDDGSNEVYYIAPFFRTQSELNQFYLTDQVLTNCYITRPSVIGQLPDNDEHHLSLNKAGRVFRFSDQAENIKEGMKGEGLISHLDRRLKLEENSIGYNLERVIMAMESIISKYYAVGQKFEGASTGSYFERTAYLARYYFECETVFLLR